MMTDINLPRPDLDSSGHVPRIGLRPREAAAALGISDRTLWEMTKKGLIPHMRLGRSVLYRVADLEQWFEDNLSGNKGP